LAAFCWTKSLPCNNAFKQGFSYFQSLHIQSYTSRRFCIDSKSEKSDPLHQARQHDFSSGRLTVQASSVQTTRTFHPDLPLCQEPSNCSWLHPSKCLSNTAERLFNVRQGKGLCSKTQIWEDSCNRLDDVCSRLNAILDKASRAYKVQPSGR
jgi:hypothetical protein